MILELIGVVKLNLISKNACFSVARGQRLILVRFGPDFVLVLCNVI